LNNKIHLSDFFKIFLERKFKTTSKSIEFAYNFLSALKKYDFDSDCALFLLIMNHELPEEIRADQLVLLNTLLEECEREEVQVRGHCEGHLPLNSFIRVIRRVIPTKGAFAFRRLEKALHLECKGRKNVLYNKLLEEDEHGNQGRFCETLRTQHVSECTTFANHVMEVIDQFARDDDVAQTLLASKQKAAADSDEEEEEEGFAFKVPTAESVSALAATHLPLSKLREALVYADPDISRAGVNKLLARGCCMGVEEMLVVEIQNLAYSVSDFKANISRGLIKKSFPNTGR